MVVVGVGERSKLELEAAPVCAILLLATDRLSAINPRRQEALSSTSVTTLPILPLFSNYFLNQVSVDQRISNSVPQELAPQSTETARISKIRNLHLCTTIPRISAKEPARSGGSSRANGARDVTAEQRNLQPHLRACESPPICPPETSHLPMSNTTPRSFLRFLCTLKHKLIPLPHTAAIKNRTHPPHGSDGAPYPPPHGQHPTAFLAVINNSRTWAKDLEVMVGKERRA